MPTSTHDLKVKYGALFGNELERELLDPESTSARRSIELNGQQFFLPDFFRKSVDSNTFADIKDPFERAKAQIELDLGIREDAGKQISAADVPMTGDLDALSKKLGISQNQIIELRKQKEAGLVAPDVPQDLNAAYERSVKANRFEGTTDRDARARQQLEWEKTGAGKEWLIQNFGGGVGGGAAGGGAGGSGGDFQTTPLTMSFKDSDVYQALPQELRDLIDTSFAAFAVGTEDDFAKMTEALKQAQAIVDPFFAAQIALTRAAFVDQIGKLTKDYEFAERATKRIRDELLEDVALRAEELSLEEQSSLARTLRGFDNKVLDLRDQAALKGTTFGTGRFTLSEDIGQAQTEAADVIQSTKRQANFERRRLANKANRGETLAGDELAQLESTFGFNLRDIGRQAESVLGTEGVTSVAAEQPQLAGTPLVGGVLGEIEVRRQEAFGRNLEALFGAQKLSADLIPKF